MDVVVPLEHRFDRTPDGAVWTQVAFAHSFWTRYLAVFDGVRMVARVRDVPVPPADGRRVDGPGVSVAAVPYFVGPWQYLRRAGQVRRAAQNAVSPGDAVIMRVSSTLADCIEPRLRRTGHPFAVEVVTDPADMFAPGSVEHPLRRFFRWWFPRNLRRQCATAIAASYVTEHALQERYPPARGRLSTPCSDVELPGAAFTEASRSRRGGVGAWTLITVGTLAQLYKAPDVLIDAVAASVREGLDLRLILVGDGMYRGRLEARATSLGIRDRVDFAGWLTAGAPVRARLDQADLFVLPSRQEGLPRALVEAMARALPCIGSAIGGIPELLSAEDLVPASDVAALARKIRDVVTDPERLARMSARNLETAGRYRDEVLHERRTAFYRHVRERTEEWLR